MDDASGTRRLCRLSSRRRERGRQRGLLGEIRCGTGAAPFRALLAAIVAYAGEVGVERVLVSVNTAREGAYRSALEAGFAIAMLGVAMVRGGDAYDHPGAWVIEDHR